MMLNANLGEISDDVLAKAQFIFFYCLKLIKIQAEYK